MGLAGKQLLMRKISVNFEVGYARVSSIVVTSRMSRAEMTYLVRQRPVLEGRALSKETAQETDEKLLAPCFYG